MSEYKEMPPKKEDESWKSFAYRQKAHIMMLEHELYYYRRMIDKVIEVKRACGDVISYHEEYVKVKE